MSHSWLLAVAYGAVCALWWIVQRFLPLWPDVERPRFAHPWREVGIVFLAILGVLLLGQLWVRGIRIPSAGAWKPAAESLNQIIIFAPIIAVPIIRRQGWASAWIRPDRLLVRLALGVGFSFIALLLFAFLERGAPSWPETIARVYTPSRAHIAVQVLLEDIAIAILFVRLAAAVGTRGAILGVAGLFAAAHVPTMIARGDVATESVALLRDFGLGVLVLSTLWRSADVAWLWPVHFSLDMTQFLSRPA